jgi:nucleoside-diphosphate-sugar epimerase
MVAKGIRVSSVRHPTTVHGERDHGFVAILTQIARDSGMSGYVGDGSNRWAAVRVLDAAQLYLKALTQAPAGAVLSSVAEEGFRRDRSPRRSAARSAYRRRASSRARRRLASDS